MRPRVVRDQIERVRTAWPWALAFFFLGMASGCAFQQHRDELVSLARNGEYQRAAEVLDDPKVKELYEPKAQVLWRLERGAAALALGQNARAVEEFGAAQRMIAPVQSRGVEDEIGSWLINDTVVPYAPPPHEDLDLSVLSMTALLASGRIDPGAVNEARNFGGKANLLRDRFNEHAAVLEEGASVEVARAKEFVESPLGMYLAALSFMAAGEKDNQRIASERLNDAIARQKDWIGPVDPKAFALLSEVDLARANTLVVAFSGHAPTLHAQRIGPIFFDKVNVYAEIPVMHAQLSRAASARAEFDDGTILELDLIEDLALVAKENHSRTLPLVQARALLRAAARAGAAYAITETVGHAQGHGSAARWLTQLALLAGQTAIERADVRSWALLPGRAFVATRALPPGEHRVRVVYRDAAGSTLWESPWESIKVGTSSLSTAVVHYWD